MSAHALLAPSSAHRWLNCTPSAVLEAKEPDTAGESAAEGTLAHAIAELKLRKHFLEPMGTRIFNSRMNKFKKDPLYSEEMQRHTDTYLDYIKELSMRYPTKPLVGVELALKPEDFLPFIPDEKGMVDCAMLHGATLHVTDFKYGKNVAVEAENNPQMMIYALGTIMHYQLYYDIHDVHLAVVQPRNVGIKEWSTTRDALMDWGQLTLKPLAAAAAKGEGETRRGDWCQFCRVKGKCRLWAQTIEDVAQFGKQPPLILSQEEIVKALEAGKPFVDWFKALEKYALTAALRGEEIPGWKAVEGRQGNRAFADVDQAFAAIQATGIDEALLYKREPLSPSAIEELFGKALLEQIGAEHISRSPGKPTLVPVSDARQPYQGIDARKYFTPQPEGGISQ